MTKATARKTSLKINTRQIMTIFDCPILFAFNWVRYKWIGLRDVKLNTENSRFEVLCSSCHQNCKWGSFTLLFCRCWHGFVHKCVPHAYFHSLDQSNLISLICGVVVAVPVVDAKALRKCDFAFLQSSLNYSFTMLAKCVLRNPGIKLKPALQR